MGQPCRLSSGGHLHGGEVSAVPLDSIYLFGHGARVPVRPTGCLMVASENIFSKLRGNPSAPQRFGRLLRPALEDACLGQLLGHLHTHHLDGIAVGFKGSSLLQCRQFARHHRINDHVRALIDRGSANTSSQVRRFFVHQRRQFHRCQCEACLARFVRNQLIQPPTPCCVFDQEFFELVRVGDGKPLSSLLGDVSADCAFACPGGPANMIARLPISPRPILV